MIKNPGDRGEISGLLAGIGWFSHFKGIVGVCWIAKGTSGVVRNENLLLSIVELGGYPDFAPLYIEYDYEVAMEKTMRKAIGFLKKQQPAVIVAEFNFQSDFRDRTSSLESLLAVVQRLSGTNVIVFYDREYLPQFDKLRARLPVHSAIAFPIERVELKNCLQSLSSNPGKCIDA